MTTTVDTDALCRVINSYCFKSIWNEPHSENRLNIKPNIKKSGKSYSGFCYAGNDIISLPNSNNSFYVYMFNLDKMRGSLNIEDRIWVDSATLCNNHDLLIHTYTQKGHMLNKALCYFYVFEKHNAVILAVPKSTIKKMPTVETEIYLTAYIDSDDVGNTEVYTLTNAIGSIAVIRQYIDNAGDDIYKFTTFLNGYNVKPTDLASLYTQGDHVELIIDNDIIGEFDVPFIAEPHTYYSSRDKLYKEIIHIPKALNPDNRLFTYNTCSMYVKKVSDDMGTYLHFSADNAVTQITFNDISIPSYILNDHRDYLGEDLLYIHVKVKRHDKDNVNIQDSNYTNILYATQSDEQIYDHLIGEIDATLTFWTADHLEQSKYTEMMFDVPNLVTEDTLSEYIAALGYYHVVSLICKRIVQATITDATNRTLTFDKPYIWQSIAVYPVVYKDGVKINADHVSYINNSTGTITITISDSVYIPIGTKLQIYLFPKGNTDIIAFTPTANEISTTIPTSVGFTIYETVNYTADVNGLYTTSTVGYIKREITEGDIVVVDNNDNTSTITFDSSNFDKEFIFCYDLATFTYQKDLSDQITNNESFVVDLICDITDDDDPRTIPFLNCKDTVVYFNGKYLTKGIDYTFVFTDALDGGITHAQICVQNMSYGNDTGSNILEVVGTTVLPANADSGFVINDIASVDLDVDIWFKGLSSIHVDGVYEHNVESTGIGLRLPENKYRVGAIFELKTTVPISVQEILSQYGNADNDIAIINVIEAYLYGYLEDPSSSILLERSHKIYSSYMNFLIDGILSGDISISYDPDTDKMLDQLSSYSYVKDFDVLFSNPDDINTRFIDIYPSYTNRVVSDNATRLLIRDLKNLILPTDDIVSSEAL